MTNHFRCILKHARLHAHNFTASRTVKISPHAISFSKQTEIFSPDFFAMAARIGVQSLSGPLLLVNTSLAARLQVRHGHRLRGKAPGVAKTLEQRLAGELGFCFCCVISAGVWIFDVFLRRGTCRRSGSGPEGQHRISSPKAGPVGAAARAVGPFEGPTGKSGVGEACEGENM